MQVKIKLLHDNVVLPQKQSPGAAAFDVHAYVPSPVTIFAGERIAIPTGFKVEVPPGYMLSLRPRSGLAVKNGITLVNSPGTIDSDFRGEVKVLMVNLGEHDFTIKNGDRIAQALLEKVEDFTWSVAEDLATTERGEGGFGSTGVS